MSESCYNCGLPDAPFAARIHLKAKNEFRRGTTQWLSFCNEECAQQTMYLQLRTRSTSDTIARFFGSQRVSYREYKGLITAGVVKMVTREQAACPETISKTRINTGAAEAKNEILGPPYVDPENGGFPDALPRLGGRPRKWKNDAERKRAERAKMALGDLGQ